MSRFSRRALPGLAALALVLGACSEDETDPPAAQPPVVEDPPAGSARDGAFPVSLVDRDLAEGQAAPPRGSRLPRRLPADPPADAGSLLDSLPGRAAMVVEWDPWTGSRHSDDVVHFYGLDRRWYRLDIADLEGLDGAPYGEGGAVGALSPDGRTWCEEFGDRLLVLDLATGSQRVVPLPYDSEGVAPRWSTSGDEIIVRERSRRDRTVRIDPHTGVLTTARWDAYTTVVTEGGAHHFATTEEGTDDVTVVSRGGGRPTSRVVLDAYMSYHGRPHTNGDTMVIKRGVQGSLRRRFGPSGIAAFDAVTGTPVRLLATTPGQTDWVMTLGWVSGHELAFTMAGSVYSWQPVDGGLRLLTDATAADRPLTDVAADLVLHSWG